MEAAEVARLRIVDVSAHADTCGCDACGIQRAEARAAADVELGVQNLKAALANAQEWKSSEKADGRTRHIVPERAMLAGALAHIERSRPS